MAKKESKRLETQKVARVELTSVRDPEVEELEQRCQALLEKLRESEDRTRELVDNASDLIYIHDLEGNFLTVNKVAETMFGYTVEEALRLNIKDVLPPESYAIARERTARKLRGEVDQGFYELQVLHRNGAVVTIELNTRLVFEGKKPVGIQGIARNITVRKESENALRESESKFRAVAETAPCAIFMYRGDRYLYVNPAMETITGYSPDELLKQTVFDLQPEGEVREMMRKRASARQSGQSVPSRYEIPIIHKSGALRWVDLSMTTVNYQGSLAVVGIGFDVTERRKTEAALRESEEKYRELVESTNEVIYALGPDAMIQYISPAVERLAGYKADDLIGRSSLDFMHPEERQARLETFKRTLDGYVQPSEYRILTKAGEPLWVRSTSQPLIKDGKTIGVRGVLININDRKRAEIALRASEARYRQLFERNLAGVYRSTLDGRILDCNESFARIFGYKSVAEVLSQPASSFYFNPADREAFIVRIRRERTITNQEMLLPRRDGSLVWIYENVSLLEEPDGTQVIEGTMIDISERKLAEEGLRRAEQKYRGIFENATEGIFQSTLDGRWLTANPTMARIFGYDSPEELIAELDLQDGYYVDPHRRGHFIELMREGRDSVFGFESQVYRKNGEVIWISENARAVRDEKKQLVGFEGLVQDITERKRAEQALIESESKFRAVADTAASAIYIHDGERFQYVNRASAFISGYSPEELMQMQLWDIVHPDNREAVLQNWKNRKQGESAPARYEFKILTRQRETRWLDFSASMIDFGGKRCLLATAFDITERKRAEQLQSALYRIAEMTSSAEDLKDFYAGIHHIVGELMYARNFYVALYDEHTKMVSFPYFVDELEPPPAARVRRRGLTEYVIETSQPLLASLEELEAMTAQGKIELLGAACIDWLGVPLKKGDTAFGALVLQSYDEAHRFSDKQKEILTFVSQQVASAIEHKRNEEALRESEARYRTLVQSAVYGIFSITPEGKFVDVNPALMNMLGYKTANELLAIDVASELYGEPEDRTRLLDEYKRSRKLNNIEAKWKRRDGTPIVVRLSGRAVVDHEGEPVLFEMIAEDVTERRALEEQLRQSQKMEAVGRLAGGVAHDFNNLLTVIKGYSELMLTELSAKDPMRTEVEEVRKAADRAAALTRQLLAFSRQQVLAPRVLDLNSVVANMDKLLKRLLGEDISLFTVLESKLGRVKADPGQIEQVIMNLAVNARDAMPRGGKLTIETANVTLDRDYAREHMTVTPGKYVMLAVSDTGSGMDEETRSHIFEPFFTTKEQGKGTGLGLSTVYGIVKQSEGYIWVYSEVGVGTTFKVYLPRVDERAEDSQLRIGTAPDLRGNETILLVEDEDGVRALVRQVLHRHGYTVLETRHGGEALLVCERHQGRIHLLLTDVVLEQMSGRELAERLSQIRPDMRVLYMSGYTDDAIVHHGVLEAGTAFLQKPFTTEALARKVRDVIDSE